MQTQRIHLSKVNVQPEVTQSSKLLLIRKSKSVLRLKWIPSKNEKVFHNSQVEPLSKFNQEIVRAMLHFLDSGVDSDCQVRSRRSRGSESVLSDAHI